MYAFGCCLLHFRLFDFRSRHGEIVARNVYPRARNVGDTSIIIFLYHKFSLALYIIGLSI